MIPAAVIIVGAGGHGRVVADAARASGLRPVAFADSARSEPALAGLPVLGAEVPEIMRAALQFRASVVVAIGDNLARKRVQSGLLAAGATLQNVVHPAAHVLGGAHLGVGVVVLAGAVIGIDCCVGDGCIINTAASLDHDCVVEDFAHLSPGVHTGGGVHIGEGVHVAIGASVRNGVSIGAWAIVGVGAAVVNDIASHVVAYGVPARLVRSTLVP